MIPYKSGKKQLIKLLQGGFIVIIKDIKEKVLIKFKNESIINSLQSGCIYMNSIKVFRRIEKETDDDKVGDVIDGLLHINEGVFYGKDIECVQELKDAAIHTKHSNDFCYCFFGIDSEHNQGSFTEEQKIKMREMGEYALIITDFPEFIHRIANVINGLNYELYGGFVTYYNPKVDSVNILISLLGKDGLKNVPLLKRDKYLFQQEFRVVIHAPDINEEYIKINIGNIEDISVKIKADELLKANFGYRTVKD